jgi:hypothetical protein
VYQALASPLAFLLNSPSLRIDLVELPSTMDGEQIGQNCRVHRKRSHLIARKEFKLIPERVSALFNLHRRVHHGVGASLHQQLERKPRIRQHSIAYRRKHVHQEC